MYKYSQPARQNFSPKNLGGQGVTLYLTIVIMTALLAIVLGLSSILVSQLKMVKGMEDSVIAFFAADTGNERGLQYLKESGIPAAGSPATDDAFLDIDGNENMGANCPADLGDDACYVVGVYASSDAECSGTGAAYYCIKSQGFYKETIRAIETEN